MGRPKNKFKRGQEVMILESYRSYPKMSTSTVIPPGLRLTVLKTCREDDPDNFTRTQWVIVKRVKPNGFDLPIPEHMLVPYSPTLELLYSGVEQIKEYY